jgi:hypothetical protein
MSKQRCSTRGRLIIGLAAGVMLAGAGSAIALASSPQKTPLSGPAINQLPAVKALKMQREMTRMDAAARHPFPKSAIHAPAPQAQPARKSSILALHESPLSSAVLTVNNLWQGRVGNSWILAYAGTFHSSTGKNVPAIALYSEPLNPNAVNQYLHFIGIYQAPQAGLTVTIASAHSGVLHLKGDHGSSVTFKVATREFATG